MKQFAIAALCTAALALESPAHADPPSPTPPPPPSLIVPCHNLFPDGFQLPPPYTIQRCPGT